MQSGISTDNPVVVQGTFAAAGALAYFGHTLFAVDVGRWLLILAGIIGFSATLVIGRRIGTNGRSSQQPILVMLFAFLVFAMPVAWLPGPRGPGFLSAAIGIETVFVLWGALRYEVRQSQSLGLARDLLWGLGWGAAMAGGFSLIALLIMALAARGASASEATTALPLILGAYWGSGVIGGLLVGSLRPFTGWPLARMFVGFLVAFCAYGAMGIAIKLSGDPEFVDTTIREQLMIALICGLMVGPPAALGTTDWGRAAA